MHPGVDVIVTDGFTGNVALKTLEGAIRGTANLVFGVLAAPRVAGRRRRGDAAPARSGEAVSTPTTSAARCSSACDGVCVVAHGSSSATAIVELGRASAVECVEAGVVERMKEAMRACRLRPTSSAARSGPTRCCG